MNVFTNHLINNSFNPNVHDLCKLVPEVNGEVRMEVVNNINNVRKLKNDFKDGGTRWVTDLRQLNDVTIKDAYPLTNIHENLQKLKGAKIITLIDTCGAYHVIQIEEGSRDCTAFISSFII